jgi:hypothetical protein
MKNEILDTRFFSARYDDLDDLFEEFVKMEFEPCNELSFTDSTYSYSTLFDIDDNKLLIEREEYGDYGTFYRYRISKIFMPVKKMSMMQIMDKMQSKIICVDRIESPKIFYKIHDGYELFYKKDNYVNGLKINDKYLTEFKIEYIVDYPNDKDISVYYAKIETGLVDLDSCNIIIKKVLSDFS